MTRSLILGNGNILVCIDSYGRVRDLYYPYVGQENHVNGNIHKTGIWVDGKFSWLDDGDWQIEIDYKKESLVSDIKAVNNKLMISLNITEAVHYNKNVFVRQVKINNEDNKKRKIKIFFHQHFAISEANLGDTVFYTPILNSLVNYKGRRYFLISGMADGKKMDEYATGIAGVNGKLGTYVDAEDGSLSKNPIEHGAVDSAISFSLDIEGKKSKSVDYWLAIGEKMKEVKDLNRFILNKKPANILKETEIYWKTWVNNKNFGFYGLDKKISDLFKRSLLIVRAQTDNHGAIIAANDTDTFYFKKDTYSYMWPRDGALIARSLDKVGHTQMTQKFFKFCRGVANENGYLLHKYRPDGSFGSSWHPWVKDNKALLPIQEDETALLLDALWKHFWQHEDKDFAKEMYPFIKKAGDFLVKFRDKKTKLPSESYDLWEEKLGMHTFTCSTVYAGLKAAKNFAELFNKKEDMKRYEKAANEVKDAIIKYLYDEDKKTFIKRLYYDSKKNLVKDITIDVSNGYGVFEYQILDVDDPRVENTMKLIEEKLFCKTNIGGVARYENDNYHRKSYHVAGNPWFISTLWLAEYYIAKAKSKKDLKCAKELLNWVVKRAMPTGVLSEQINPDTGHPVSVSPLTWSHAGFIIAVIKYLDKLESFKKKNKIK